MIRHVPNVQPVFLFSDNKTAVAMTNNQTSKYPMCMALMHILVFQCFKFNIKLTMKCTSCIQYEIAYSLSHFKLQYFCQTTPKAQQLSHFTLFCVADLLATINDIQTLAVKDTKNTRYNAEWERFHNFLILHNQETDLTVD